MGRVAHPKRIPKPCEFGKAQSARQYKVAFNRRRSAETKPKHGQLRTVLTGETRCIDQNESWCTCSTKNLDQSFGPTEPLIRNAEQRTNRLQLVSTANPLVVEIQNLERSAFGKSLPHRQLRDGGGLSRARGTDQRDDLQVIFARSGARS